MDFDPRDYDSRDDDRHAFGHARGGRDSSHDDVDHDDDLRLPDDRNRDREHARELSRGPGDSRQLNHDGQDGRDDTRWAERERNHNPPEVFTRHLNLPRGREREIVRDRDREYMLRGSETRTLATVGAFRVVSSRDLQDHRGRQLDPRSGDLRHLREQRLVETVRVPGSREHAVALTGEGGSLLQHHRDRVHGDRQAFWHGVKREREPQHDIQVYRAYERAAARLAHQGAQVERVLLDHELTRNSGTSRLRWRVCLTAIGTSSA